MKQLALRLPRRGGKRRGAGASRRGGARSSPIGGRPEFEKPAAVQVSLSVAGHVWNLRSRRCFEVIEASLASARERFGLRVIEFTVLGNHLHLVVEADNDEALSRGMQGLNIRIAKALNRLMDRKGHVFADHYHSRLLRSPTELVNAIAYVLGNAAHHYGESGRIRSPREPTRRHAVRRFFPIPGPGSCDRVAASAHRSAVARCEHLAAAVGAGVSSRHGGARPGTVGDGPIIR